MKSPLDNIVIPFQKTMLWRNRLPIYYPEDLSNRLDFWTGLGPNTINITIKGWNWSQGVEISLHNWYHFLSLYLSMTSWAELANFSDSLRICSALSSSWFSLSPLSIISLCALLTSLVALFTLLLRSWRLPGMCLATDLLALPLESPTETKQSLGSTREI